MIAVVGLGIVVAYALFGGLVVLERRLVRRINGGQS